MKPSHEVLPSALEALRYFGQLDARQVVEKLALRGEVFTVQEVAETLAGEAKRERSSRLVSVATFPGNAESVSDAVVYIARSW